MACYEVITEDGTSLGIFADYETALEWAEECTVPCEVVESDDYIEDESEEDGYTDCIPK